jgi:hypothetical protein
MAAVVEEYIAIVKAGDIFDYGYAPTCQRDPSVSDFLDPDTRSFPPVDLIITNPPFSTADDFALKATVEANIGAAMLVRTQWIEGLWRYEKLFCPCAPTLFAPFVERVPITKGRWDPAASTATSYAWFVWMRGAKRLPPFWIPPGCRKRLTCRRDIARFAAPIEAPLLEAAP